MERLNWKNFTKEIRSNPINLEQQTEIKIISSTDFNYVNLVFKYEVPNFPNKLPNKFQV